MKDVVYDDPAGLLHRIKRGTEKDAEIFCTLGGKACFTSTWNLARWLYLRALDQTIDVAGAHASCKRVAEFGEGQKPGTEVSTLSPDAATEWMQKLCPA